MPSDLYRRTAPYITDGSTTDTHAEWLPKPVPATIADPPPPEYQIAPAWVDTAGRTRTWALKDPTGTQLAEITTKNAARKLADLLNRVMGDDGQAR